MPQRVHFYWYFFLKSSWLLHLSKLTDNCTLLVVNDKARKYLPPSFLSLTDQLLASAMTEGVNKHLQYIYHPGLQWRRRPAFYQEWKVNVSGDICASTAPKWLTQASSPSAWSPQLFPTTVELAFSLSVCKSNSSQRSCRCISSWQSDIWTVLPFFRWPLFDGHHADTVNHKRKVTCYKSLTGLCLFFHSCQNTTPGPCPGWPL